jgi:hypothetical protein
MACKCVTCFIAKLTASWQVLDVNASSSPIFFFSKHSFRYGLICNMHSSSILVAIAATAAAQSNSSFTPTMSNNRTIETPEEATYLLPPTFSSNVSSNSIDKITTNSTLDALFSQALSSPFISYFSEFTSLLGPNIQLELVAQDPTYVYAYETGAWVPQKNEVWFTPHHIQWKLHALHPQSEYLRDLATQSFSGNSQPQWRLLLQ